MKKLEKILKRIVLGLINILIPHRKSEADPGKWREFRKVLVFRFDNRIGNSILILSLVQAIKKSLPETGVHVMMTSSYSELYRGHPDIDKVLPYDQGKLLRNPLRFIKLAHYLRSQAYDVVFSSSNPNALSVSQALFARIIGKKHSVGFDAKNSREIYSDVVEGNTSQHYAFSQIDLWRFFDKNAPYQMPRLYIPTGEDRSSTAWVLFWIGATGQKILPFSLIEQILKLFHELEIDYELAAGPHDKHFISGYPESFREKVNFLSGSLAETAAYLKRFRIMCTPDTGPMHMAAALNINLVQIFINSDATWYAYPGPDNFLIRQNIDRQTLTSFLNRFAQVENH